jgi:amino acid adenylation domain-containing protein
MMAGEQLSIVNHPPSKIRGPELLHELVRGSAGGNRSALEFQPAEGPRQRFSYAQLHNISDELADHLQSMLDLFSLPNGHKQATIPFLIPQSPELYVTVLAVLKAGAAFCPLHLDAPQDRLKFIIEDTSAKVVFTTCALKAKLEWESGPEIILVDTILKGLGTHSDRGRTCRLRRCEPGDLAYVMYTSGSTGLPKPVGVSHVASTQSLLAHEKHIPQFNRFLQFAAPTFDVFVFEMFFPLSRGETVVGCDRNELLVDLPAMMNRLDIDAAELTPTVVGTLLRKRSHVPNLKLLLTIGETLTPPIIDEFGSSSSRAGILHGLYGPTEAAVHCTSVSRFPSDFKSGIIGSPLETVSCLITAIHDSEKSTAPDLNVLPRGHVGELVIGGTQLAVGYLNRPDQTASAFVDTQAYGRLYKTGDKARLLPNGLLEYLGRIDKAQVKLRGQRVELGEIEQVAYQTKGIESATAVLINGSVVLFCVSDNPELTPKDLIAACRRWLPGFMVPGDVILLEQVPRTPSGKIDRLALQVLYGKQHALESSVNQDQLDDIDTLVIRAVHELLAAKIDIHTNLTAAGLDSLKSITLASMLRTAEFNIGAVDILKANSIQAIADRLRHSRTIMNFSECADTGDDWSIIYRKALDGLQMILPTSEIEAIEDIIPCTSSQTAMLTEMLVNNQAYCNWIELQCSSTIEFINIKAAVMSLGRRNEILRTGFAQIRDQVHPFVQVVWNNIPEPQVILVSTLERDFQVKTAKALLTPLRIQVQVSGARTSILIQIHHGLYDGWSWEHVVNDWDLILQNQEIAPRPQFRDLVKFYRHPIVKAKSALAKEYWRHMLQDARQCIFPNLQSKRDVPPCLRVTHIRLSTRVAEVESTSQKLNVSAQAIVQAVFAWLLSIYVADSNVIFGTVSSGRTLPLAGIEDIIGPCIATFPVCLDVAHSRTVQDLVVVVHNLSRKMLDHQEVSLHEIKKACGFQNSHALFDSIFIWQQTLRNRTPKILTQSDAAEYVEFSLSIEIEPLEDYFHVKANYQHAKLPEAQVMIFLQQMDQLIALFARNPAMPLVELGHHLGEQVLSIENPIPEEYHGRVVLSHAVEVLAEEDPTRIALEFFQDIRGVDMEAERVSYRSLNEQANQVAHYLLRQGLSEDELIGICLEKSVKLYVGILGIIKAGAGYLPLTPQMPIKRRNHILTESKVKICISDSVSIGIAEKLEEERRSNDRALSSRNGDNLFGEPPEVGFPPSVAVFCINKIDLLSMPLSNPLCNYRPSNLAYAIFTSGTSGVPKGVLVTQANMLSNLLVLSRLYPISRRSRLLQACSQAFDGKHTELVSQSGFNLRISL